MGNRAVVTVEGSKVGVYLHWNGGQESVQAFLRAAKDLGVRDPLEDTAYFFARFVQIVSNFIGGTTSVGVGLLSELDTNNHDNGVYVVGERFEIVRWEYEPKNRGLLDVEREAKIYGEVMYANRAAFAK